MKVLIEVENIRTRESKDYECSRVPCNGEGVVIEDVAYTVVSVYHKLDADEDNDSVAIVRVK